MDKQIKREFKGIWSSVERKETGNSEESLERQKWEKETSKKERKRKTHK